MLDYFFSCFFNNNNNNNLRNIKEKKIIKMHIRRNGIIRI